MDFEKVTRWAMRNCDLGRLGAGKTTMVVEASDFDALLAAHRETLAILKNIACCPECDGQDANHPIGRKGTCLRHGDVTRSNFDNWLSEARSELAKESA